MRLTTEERLRLDERATDPEDFARREREAEERLTEGRRLWAAVMATSNLEVCRSIVAGRPVLARQLDAAALRRALRGRPLPHPERYITLDGDALDAVAEGGPFRPREVR